MANETVSRKFRFSVQNKLGQICLTLITFLFGLTKMTTNNYTVKISAFPDRSRVRLRINIGSSLSNYHEQYVR